MQGFLDYILASVRSGLKAEAFKKLLVSLILKALALSGPAGFFAKFIVPKLVKWGLIAASDLVEKAQDNETLKEFEKAKDKPSSERDQLEKDILTGK